MFKFLLVISLTIFSVSANSGFLQVQESSSPQLYNELRNSTTFLDSFLMAFDGFASTSGIYAEMPAFEACKVNDLAVIESTISIINNLTNKQYDTLVDDIKGLVDSAYNVYKQCDFVGFKTQLLQGLSDFKTNFTQADYMKKFLSKLQSNIFQIMADLKTIIDKSTAGNMEEFGKGLGNLMRTLFVVA